MRWDSVGGGCVGRNPYKDRAVHLTPGSDFASLALQEQPRYVYSVNGSPHYDGVMLYLREVDRLEPMSRTEEIEFARRAQRGEPLSRAHTAQRLNLTPEYIRQIEVKALHKMRHPCRLRTLLP